MKTACISALLGALAIVPAPAAAQGAADTAYMEPAMCYALPLGLAPAQRDLFCEAATRRMASTDRLTRLDDVIAELPAANPANAMLQTMKAQTLVGLGRREEALAYVRQTMRAFPRLPPVWLGAIQVFAFTEHPEAAADFWIELSRFNPAVAKSIEEYYWLALAPRLGSTGNWAKLKDLAVALDAIGYDGGSEASRSLLADTLFRMKMEQGDVAGARVQLERVSNPATLAEIMSNERLSAVWEANPWADAERRGPIVRSWIDDLGRAAIDDGLQTSLFLRAVAEHVGPDAVVAAYEPVLRAQMAKGPAGPDSFDFSFWVPGLAGAHVAAGRPDVAEALYRDASAHFASLNSPVRLNATSNYALFLQRQGRDEEALPLIEEAIEALYRAGGVNPELLQMHAVRALALDGLGRSREAAESIRVLERNRGMSLATYVDTMLELGRFEPARDALVDALESDAYMSAVRLLQPPIAAYRSPFDERIQALRTRLAQDRRVQRALAGKGRVLDFEPVRLDPFELPDLAPGLLPE